jgi:oxygen-independent coproporphyrinogen-3 oxidase
MGLQSAQDRELKALGRIHSYRDFLTSYALLRENGFDNLNIDLMADIPCQTLESYRDTLSKVLALEPEHISSYSLMVEEGTPFYQMQQEGKLFLPDEDTDRQMYALTQEMLVTKGYERYEISNYAKEGKACLHNQTYWKMGEYLGIGLGAASYFQGCRFSNVADYAEYISFPVKELSGKHIPLTKKEEMEEYVFLGLRMMQGISTTEYRKRFDVDFYQQYETVLPELFEKCLLAEDANHGRIYLTNQGIDVSNRVLAEFLLD